jgi:hypothetical protein
MSRLSEHFSSNPDQSRVESAQPAEARIEWSADLHQHVISVTTIRSNDNKPYIAVVAPKLIRDLIANDVPVESLKRAVSQKVQFIPDNPSQPIVYVLNLTKLTTAEREKVLSLLPVNQNEGQTIEMKAEEFELNIIQYSAYKYWLSSHK